MRRRSRRRRARVRRFREAGLFSRAENLHMREVLPLQRQSEPKRILVLHVVARVFLARCRFRRNTLQAPMAPCRFLFSRLFADNERYYTAAPRYRAPKLVYFVLLFERPGSRRRRIRSLARQRARAATALDDRADEQGVYYDAFPRPVSAGDARTEPLRPRPRKGTEKRRAPLLFGSIGSICKVKESATNIPPRRRSLSARPAFAKLAFTSFTSRRRP